MFLVAGATGSLGSAIVRGLLERGDVVRALVRESADYTSLVKAGASIAVGDLREPASLVAACDGVTTIVSTASATRRGDDTPANVDAQGNRNLIDAARRAGGGHYILISTIGASADSPVPAFRAKAEAEAALKQSGLDYTIVQANAFMDVWFGMLIEMPLATGQPVTLVGEAARRHSFIAERDIVAFVLAATKNPAARNATLVIGGPAAVSLREVVSAYETALGCPIDVRSVAPGDPIPGLPEPIWGIVAALEAFDSPIPMEDTARAYGVSLTTAQDHAARSGLAGATA